jgi:hypothetical protein
MRWAAYGLAWAFVLGAAAYDARFAWEHRDTFGRWEQNPAARWAADRYGLRAVLGFKFAALFLAATVAAYCLTRRPRLSWATTALVVAVHGALACHYLAHRDPPTPALVASTAPRAIVHPEDAEPTPAHVLPIP